MSLEIIEKIRLKLEEYPEFSPTITPASIAVPSHSERGFLVRIDVSATQYVVGFGGWHEHFDDGEEAIECFMCGLLGRSRLKIHYCGDFPYRWSAQIQDGKDWVDVSESGLFLFPFWRRRRIEYRINDPAEPS